MVEHARAPIDRGAVEALGKVQNTGHRVAPTHSKNRARYQGRRATSVREIQEQARAERVPLTMTPTTRRSMPRVHLTAPPGEPKKERRTVTVDDLHHAEADHQAGELPQQLAGVRQLPRRSPAPDVIAAALPAAKRATVIENARAITTFLNELNRALWEIGKLMVVSDGGDADSTRH
jgi:hypothetical protein